MKYKLLNYLQSYLATKGKYERVGVISYSWDACAYCLCVCKLMMY